MKRVLDLPAYRRLLLAFALNELAWAFGALALAVLVYRRTGSATWTTVFFLSSMFIPALVSPAVVAQLDQLSPRAVLATLYLLEGAAFGLLAWLVDRFSLGPVLALAFVDGVLAVSARALARAATVAVLEPVGLLREGNAMVNAAMTVAFTAGPAIAGAVVALGGTVAALLVTCGLLLAIALVLATGQLPAAPTQRAPVAGRLRAALSHAVHSVPIRNVLLVQVAGLVFFTISIPVEVVFAQRTLHAGAGGYGALLSCWGAGAVAGSVGFARWRGSSMRPLIAASCALLGVGFLIMAVAPSLGVAIAGAVLAGVGNGVEAAAVRTALQELVEAGWMGMMMSLAESVNQATPGIGIVLGGAITALFSARVALGVAGGGALAMTGVTWVALRPAVTAAGGNAEPRAAEGGRGGMGAAGASR